MENNKLHFSSTSLLKESSSTLFMWYVRQSFMCNSSISLQNLTFFAPVCTFWNVLKTNEENLSLQSHFRNESRSPQFFRFFSFNNALIGILGVFLMSWLSSLQLPPWSLRMTMNHKLQRYHLSCRLLLIFHFYLILFHIYSKLTNHWV